MSTLTPDLPEPEWWAEARALAARGFSAYKIGLTMGRDARSVRYAINEEYRERHRAQSRAWQKRHGNHRNNPHVRDKGREYARQEARARWRAEGRTRSLFDYYRESQCL